MSAIILIYTICLTVMFFSGSMIMMGEGMRQYQNYIIIIVLSIMIMNILIVKKKININLKNKATIFMLLYFIAATVSAITNNNIRMFLNSAQLLSIYLTISLLASRIFEDKYLKIIIIAMLISHIPLLIVSFLTTSIVERPYTGVFYNPNSFGTLIASVFPIILVVIDEQIIKEHKNAKIKIKNAKTLTVGLLILLFLLYLVLISESRTSLATVLILIFIYIFLLSKKLGAKSFIIKVFPLALLIIFTSLMIPPVNKAVLQVVGKNSVRLQHKAGIMAGRFDFWSATVEYAKLFGNGHNFFGVIVKNNAHNTFFEILGIYGWIPLSFFLMWIIFTFFKSLKYTNYYNVRFNNFPLLMLVTFILLSVGEGMLMKLSMFVMFASVGPILQNK